ncbi:MAG TPA: DUF2950 domain-containing protein [Bryobacteraceae bacterium]|jgi:hypothetical protein|nr:DUF2950 domain-containing protein [Bryobacteraceae bacterium]
MNSRHRDYTFQRAILAAVFAVLLASPLAAGAKAVAANQSRFSTPEEAVAALARAAQAKDQTALAAIFGPDRAKLLTGDSVIDEKALEHFAVNLAKSHRLEKVTETKFTLLVGADNWPSPIPIVKDGGQWRFDTTAGLDEILNRHIGEDELSAILTCRAYVLAQWEYYTEPNGTAQDGLAVYAQKFTSSPGKRDGLYWETPPGAKPSPLGSLVAQARTEGYSAGQARPRGTPWRPYHGYYFKILKRQGPHAPGGSFSYVLNGNMVAGYALFAYPDKWGSSGIMTFIVNQQGRVYEKNLGPRTGQIAAGIVEYDPDATWKLVKE